jgi:hypothetical protein
MCAPGSALSDILTIRYLTLIVPSLDSYYTLKIPTLNNQTSKNEDQEKHLTSTGYTMCVPGSPLSYYGASGIV